MSHYFDLELIPYGKKTLQDEIAYVHYLGRKMFIANNVASFYTQKKGPSVAVPWLVSDYASALVGAQLLDRETRRRLERYLDQNLDRVQHRHQELLRAYREGDIDYAIDHTPAIVISSTLGLHETLMESVNLHTPGCYVESDSLQLSQAFLDVFPESYFALR